MRVRRSVLFASLLCGLALAAGTLRAQAPPAASAASGQGPWLGTWKLNVAQSTYSPGPGPAAGTVSLFKMVPVGDGFKYTIDSTTPQGRTFHAELTGKFDGKDYPEIGNPGADTNRFRILSDRSYEVIDTKNGVDTMTIVITISPDGKTRRSESKGKNLEGKPVHNVTVWDRQP
jgi:hypothetical protein